MATSDEVLREHQRTWAGFIRLMFTVAFGVALLVGILGLVFVR